MQERRAILSVEQKEKIRELDRIKRQKQRQSDNTDNNNKNGEERLDDDSNVVEDESEVEYEDKDEDEDEDEGNPLTEWKLYRDRRNAQNRISKRARYARLKEAEAQLKIMTTVGENCAIMSGDDNDIQQLQLLANKRQQLLADGRQNSQNYRQMHPNQHRRWMTIQQTWDEDNPCR
jgi:hypothetical protein